MGPHTYSLLVGAIPRRVLPVQHFMARAEERRSKRVASLSIAGEDAELYTGGN